MTTIGTIYAEYLAGFTRCFGTDDATVIMDAAYALGAFDRDLVTGSAKPLLRSASGVLDALRELVPNPEDLPVDTGAMLARGCFLEAEVDRLTKALSDVATASDGSANAPA